MGPAAAVFAALAGAAVGSFAAVAVERLRDGRSLGGRSTCACGRQLRAGENLPIVGWVRTGGQARCCGARIPAWYLGAEIAAAAVTVAGQTLAGPAGAAGAAAATVAVAVGVGMSGRRRDEEGAAAG